MKTFSVSDLPTFKTTITLLNRLDGRNSKDHVDRWKKTVLHGCAWAGQRTQRPSSRLSTAAEVNEGTAYTVRIPPSDDYSPYIIWKKDMEGFTVSPGDYVIRGELPGPVTAETVLETVERYRPDAFQITLFRDNTGTGYLDHYRLEGQ